MNFHCVPNQVLYQAEPLPDGVTGVEELLDALRYDCEFARKL